MRKLLKKTELLFLLVALSAFFSGVSSLADGEDIRILVPEVSGSALQNITDNDVNSRFTLEGKDELRLMFRKTGEKTVLLQFHEKTKAGLQVTVLNTEGTATQTLEIPADSFETYINLPDGTRFLSLQGRKGFSLSECHIVKDGEQKEDPFTKTEGEDLLLIAAHTGDEVSVFGGLLADCAEKGYSAKTVFVSTKTRKSTQEAMDTAEAMGEQIRPLVLDYQYLKLYKLFEQSARKVWKEKEVLTSLVREIRRTKPKVVVTHSSEGEDADGMNAFLSSIAEQAVDKAARRNFDSVSYRQYGTHQVEKLYLHLEDGETAGADITLDYSTKLKRFEDRSAKEVADEAIDSYSILRVFAKESEEKGRFRLLASAVGEDSGKNDLFENTDAIPAADASVIQKRLEPCVIASPMDAPENDVYFRQEGEPAEVVVQDPENGHWEYRSDTLSVLVEKHVKPEIPLVYYVAHVRMRKIDAFRPGFGFFNEDGGHKVKPYLLARRAKAVLAMTGDQCVNTEEMRKGTLVRNGRLYGKGRSQPTMVLTKDMRMRIYEKMTPVQTILDDGVQNSFGFGPVLVRNGKVSKEECNLHRVKNKNPRAGLGMVEAGHFVCIAVDGRQKDHSVGLTLEDYAPLFVEEGCMLAYNMDGGISEGMYFMGEAVHQHKHSGLTGGGRQREWADAVMFGYSDLVPTEFDPVYNQGSLDTKIEITD